MKYQEQDLQNEKEMNSSNTTERILTKEEGRELVQYSREMRKRFRAYMEMMEAQEQAEKEAQKKD